MPSSDALRTLAYAIAAPGLASCTQHETDVALSSLHNIRLLSTVITAVCYRRLKCHVRFMLLLCCAYPHLLS